MIYISTVYKLFSSWRQKISLSLSLSLTQTHTHT